MKKSVISCLVLCVVSVVFCVTTALAMPAGPTAYAGFSGLPLRNCEGMACGELAKLPIATQVNILLNDNEGWAFVQVPSLNKTGWINTHNIFPAPGFAF